MKQILSGKFRWVYNSYLISSVVVLSAIVFLYQQKPSLREMDDASPSTCVIGLFTKPVLLLTHVDK